MRNLLIHNPCNEITRRYRDYNLFWDDLTEELKKNHNVSENRYYEDAHCERMKIQLKKRTNDFLEILECEYVIEDLDNGDFWILSVAEQITGGILLEQSNPHLKKVLYSQYIPDQIVHHCKENSNKYIPWIFFPQNVVDLEKYYEKRKEKTELIEKLYFKGGVDYRPIVNYIDKKIISETNRVSIENYFDDLINYKMCLSIGGVGNGDLCYRDIECMSLGIPFLRFDFVTTLNPPLIPNYHYISIPLQLDFPKHNDVLKDRLGEEKHAKLIEQRYYEVINDNNLLKYISKNAKEYYDKYLSPKNRIKHTLNLLEL
jgi:hypothetical protein